MEEPMHSRIQHKRALGTVVGAGHTHVGGRENNEDVAVADSKLGLFAVLDGMGGHAAGEVAAEIASNTLTEFIRGNAAGDRGALRELLESGIKHASVAVYEAGKRNSAWRGMGCTVVACLVFDATFAVVGHVGDSRAYLLRGRELQPLTRDHTSAREPVEKGRMDAEETERLNRNPLLSQALGTGRTPQPDMLDLELQPGDRILLCSDGLYECVSLDAIATMLRVIDEPGRAAQRLVETALAGDENQDNVSAVVVAVQP
jgi:protein phosphatase